MRLSEQAKTDKKAETDKLPWTWRNWMKWCHFWTYLWNFKEFYSLFIFIALVTRSPLFSKLRTCKVFGTPSTRINVTFGIPPFLSLGECGTREVRTLKTQLGWFLEVSINVSILLLFNIQAVRHFDFLHTDNWTSYILATFLICILCIVHAMSPPR